MVYYDELRYKLMPYIYTINGMAHFNDYTLMRSLAMSYTGDKNTYSIGDQFLLGPSLMVCPVYKYEARKRDVYFPAGIKWYDFYTGKTIDGGQKMSVEAPLERIPLFVPAGSILPVGPVKQYAAEKKADDIEIWVYAGKDGKFSLYEDEGVNYNYEKGNYSNIVVEYNNAENKLTIGKREGEFSGMLNNRTFRVKLIGKAGAEVKVIQYKGSKVEVKL